MIGVGVIGYGYWGPNLVRNFYEAPGCKVIGVSDLRPERLALVQNRYPDVAVTLDQTELFSDSRIDAIVVATPVSSHFPLARRALQSGKHVLVEKPLAASAEEVSALIDEAARRNCVLMVDHTFVYGGAVRKIKHLIDNDGVGELYYYDSARINLGLFQHDVNVIWDLAVHDLSIMDYVIRARPRAVSATGLSHVPGEPENIAYLTLFFDECLIAHVHVNWLAPVKVRRTLIGGSHKMIVYDDLEPSEKVKVYDKGITFSNGNGHGSGNAADKKYQMLIGYRTGDMWAPQLDMTEALRTEALHFLRCIDQSEQPLTDGQAGLRVVQILEAATRSLRERGRPIELARMEVPA